MYLTTMRYLGKDPEVRFTQERKKLTVMRMPCNQYPTRKEEIFWWRMTIWGNEFDKFISYLTDKNGVLQVSLRTLGKFEESPTEQSPLEKGLSLSKGFNDRGGNTLLGLYDAKTKLKHSFSEFYLIKFLKGVSKRLAKIFVKDCDLPFDERKLPEDQLKIHLRLREMF